MPAQAGERLVAVARDLAHRHPDEAMPDPTRRTVCDALAAVRPALSGMAAAGVDVLVDDDGAGAGEALAVVTDVRRSLDICQSGGYGFA